MTSIMLARPTGPLTDRSNDNSPPDRTFRGALQAMEVLA
jgi:hypothetical protein